MFSLTLGITSHPIIIFHTSNWQNKVYVSSTTQQYFLAAMSNFYGRLPLPERIYGLPRNVAILMKH